jgi:Uma2 family endonuclease
MTVELARRVMWSPDPTRQRLARHFIEDVLNLPYDAPRVELRDGVMIVVPVPTIAHQQIGNLLWAWLRQHAPEEFEPVTAAGIAVGLKDTLEPDVLLLRRPVVGTKQFLLPSQVAIVVEVVLAGTRSRDRVEKPAQYADVRIPHFWRIEQHPVRVFAYDLVGDHYELVADSDDKLVLTAPFAIELPIREITP